MSSKRIKIYIAIAIILVSVAQAVWFFKNGVFDYVDGGLANYPVPYAFLSNFFIYTPFNYTGLISGGGNVFGLIVWLFWDALILLFGHIFGVELFYGLLMAAGGIGIVVLLLDILEGYGALPKLVAGVSAFSIFTLFGVNPAAGPAYHSIGVFLPIAVLALYRLYKVAASGSKDNSRYAKYSFLFIIGAGGLATFGGAGYIIQNSAILLSIFLVLLLMLQKNRKKFVYYSVIALFITMLLNATTVVGNYYSLKTVGNEFFNSGSFWVLYNLNRQTLFSALQVGSSGFSAILDVSILLIALTSLLAVFKPGKKEFRSIVLALFVGLFVISFLYENYALPFGNIFNFVIDHFNELLVLRYSGSSFFYIEYFLFGTLFGIGSAFITKELLSKNRLFAYLFALLVAVILLAWIYYFDYLPLETNISITIPNHVFELSDYLNKLNGTYNIALLPSETPFYHISIWYRGTDVYTYLLDHPAFTGGYVAYSEVLFPISQGEYFNIARYFQSARISSSIGIAKEFGALGIEYIVVQGDTLSNGYEDFNMGYLYNNLNQTNAFEFKARFENSSVYKNNFYAPLVYAANIVNIGNATPSSVFSYIGYYINYINKTVVYSNSTSIYNSTGKAVMAVGVFESPSIKFAADTPTAVIVHIKNATTPYYLVFRETYDPHWAAFYSNGTEVNPSYHIAVNGFANAWYMNKTGSYTVTLYYTLQTYAWIAWAVSLIALGVTVAIGVYGWGLYKHGK